MVNNFSSYYNLSYINPNYIKRPNYINPNYNYNNYNYSKPGYSTSPQQSAFLSDRISSVASISIPESNEIITTLYPQTWDCKPQTQSGSLNSETLDQFPISYLLISPNSDNLIQSSHLFQQDLQSKNETSKIPTKTESKKRKITLINAQESNESKKRITRLSNQKKPQQIITTLMSQVSDLNSQLIQLYQTYLPSDTINVKLQSLNSELFAINKNAKKQSITNLKLEKKLLKNKILKFNAELVQKLTNQNYELNQINEYINKENQRLTIELKKWIRPQKSKRWYDNFNELE